MNYKEVAKKFFIPGYALYREIQKPKEKKNFFWMAGFGIQTAYLVAKLLITPAYIHNGIANNEWNFIEYVKKEVIGTKKSKKDLEKIINFNDYKAK